jgi:hypothetical protein
MKDEPDTRRNGVMMQRRADIGRRERQRQEAERRDKQRVADDAAGLPPLTLLDMIETDNNRRMGRIATATEELADALRRIDVSLARVADAMEALANLFHRTMGSAKYESGGTCEFIRVAGPLGVRGDDR